MLRHIVLFQFQGFENEAQKLRHLLRLKTALEALPEEIEVLRSLRVHNSCNPAEPYDLILEAEVNCIDCLSVYNEHPAHQQILTEMIRPYLQGRAAIDYNL